MLRRLAALMLLLLAAAPVPAATPTFVVRKADGTELRSELASLDEAWTAAVGKRVTRRLAAPEWLSLRQAGVPLPPLPIDEQIVLANGDRLPARDLRLDDEKLRFRHPD